MELEGIGHRPGGHLLLRDRPVRRRRQYRLHHGRRPGQPAVPDPLPATGGGPRGRPAGHQLPGRQWRVQGRQRRQGHQRQERRAVRRGVPLHRRRAQLHRVRFLLRELPREGTDHLCRPQPELCGPGHRPVGRPRRLRLVRRPGRRSRRWQRGRRPGARPGQWRGSGGRGQPGQRPSRIRRRHPHVRPELQHDRWRSLGLR
ncbi:hypothetical protein D9M69_535970 [compost metagenome]